MIYECKDNSVSAQVSGSKSGGEPGCRLFREGGGSSEYGGFREVGSFQMHLEESLMVIDALNMEDKGKREI